MTLLAQQKLSAQKEIDSGSEFTGNALLAGNFCLLSTIYNSWILDSGASYHICSSLDLFNTYTLLSSENNITIPGY